MGSAKPWLQQLIDADRKTCNTRPRSSYTTRCPRCVASLPSPSVPAPQLHPKHPQALLTFTATATDGQCTQAATDSTKASVTSYMQSQTGVNELQVSVTCYNANGTIGGSARRRLQQVRRGVLVGNFMSPAYREAPWHAKAPVVC